MIPFNSGVFIISTYIKAIFCILFTVLFTLLFIFMDRHQTIFFVYDHRKHREEDDPKDAVLYFYPPSVSISVYALPSDNISNHLFGWQVDSLCSLSFTSVKLTQITLCIKSHSEILKANTTFAISTYINPMINELINKISKVI